MRNYDGTVDNAQCIKFEASERFLPLMQIDHVGSDKFDTVVFISKGYCDNYTECCILSNNTNAATSLEK